MTSDAVLQQFDDIGIWKQGDQRAPHKPLLVLYALGRWQQGKSEVTYSEAEPALTALLRDAAEVRGNFSAGRRYPEPLRIHRAAVARRLTPARSGRAGRVFSATVLRFTVLTCRPGVGNGWPRVAAGGGNRLRDDSCTAP